MKLLIACPAYGAQVFVQWYNSFRACDNVFAELGVEVGIIHESESLIPRSRNRQALFALEQGYDRILTIDADIVWSPEDMRRILTSPHKVTGGVYPLKTFPVCMNFNPLPDRGTELRKTERSYDWDAWTKFKEKYADPQGYVEVRHLATGFLSVDCEVLSKLSLTAEVYGTRDATDGEFKGFFDFYPAGVYDQQYLSEDWKHCEMIREAGYPVMLDTQITLGHIGLHEYRINQVFGKIST